MTKKYLTMLLALYSVSCSDSDSLERRCSLEECETVIRKANFNEDEVKRLGFGHCVPYSVMNKINPKDKCLEPASVLSCGNETDFHASVAEIANVYEDSNGDCWETGGQAKPTGWIPLQYSDSYSGECTKYLFNSICEPTQDSTENQQTLRK